MGPFCTKKYSRRRNGTIIILKYEKITKTRGIYDYLRCKSLLDMIYSITFSDLRFTSKETLVHNFFGYRVFFVDINNIIHLFQSNSYQHNNDDMFHHILGYNFECKLMVDASVSQLPRACLMKINFHLLPSILSLSEPVLSHEHSSSLVSGSDVDMIYFSFASIMV